MTDPSDLTRRTERLEDLSVQPTPLYAPTFKACNTNDWTEWLGHTVPGSYASLAQELEAVFRGAGIEDVSPRGKYLITGPGADRYLGHLTIADCAAMSVGDCLVTPFCHANGKVINIAEVSRIGNEAFWLTVPGRHAHWLHEAAKGFDVRLEDQSAQFAGLRLVGPRTRACLEAAGLGPVAKISRGETRRYAMKDFTLIVSHPNSGIEEEIIIWCTASRAAAFWQKLMLEGEALGLCPIGRRASEAYRIECGIPVAGHEFVPAPEAIHADRRRSAIELGYGALLNFDKGIFNGRSALIDEGRRARSLVLVKLAFEGAPPVPGVHLHREGAGRPVGVLTSSARLPDHPFAVGLGFVARGHETAGTDLVANDVAKDELIETAHPVRGRILTPILFTK